MDDANQTPAVITRLCAAYQEVALCESWLALNTTRQNEDRQRSQAAMVSAQERTIALIKEQNDASA